MTGLPRIDARTLAEPTFVERLARLAGLVREALEATGGDTSALCETANEALAGLGPSAPRLDALARAWHLADWQEDTWLLACVAAVDSALAQVLRGLDPAGEGTLRLQTARRLFPGPRLADWLSWTRQAPCFRLGLIEAAPGAAGERVLRVDPERAEALLDLTSPPPAPAPPDVGLEEWAHEQAVRALHRALGGDAPVLGLLVSTDAGAAWQRAAALAESAGRTLRRVPLPPQPAIADLPALRAQLGTCLAEGSVPVLVPAEREAGGDDEPTEARRLLLDEALPDHPGFVLALVERPWRCACTRRPLIAAECTPLSVMSHTRAWLDAVLPAPGARGTASEAEIRWAGALARLLPVEPAEAHAIAQDARAHAVISGRAPDHADLLRAARLRFAQRVRGDVDLRPARARLSDLVVPPETFDLLCRAIRRAEASAVVLDTWSLARPFGARGRALRLLFSGPPGTGKTLAAEAVSAALGRDLLVLDAGRVLSKWLGETERNLARAFAAAEAARAVLLIDEADALFARRTEVKDAHDRWANAGTSFLLQRMESFDGVVILATNQRTQFDPAYGRRLDLVIDFPAPDRTQRLALWRATLPAAELMTDAASREVVCATLADWYELSGAQIRNAVLAACAEAAAAGRGLQARDLVSAVAHELSKTATAFPGAPPWLADSALGAPHKEQSDG